MCSETSEAVGTTWEHAQSEFQKFLKIRIPLLKWHSYRLARKGPMAPGAQLRLATQVTTPLQVELALNI